MPSLIDPTEPSNVVVGVVDVGSPKNIGWAILAAGVRVLGSDLDEFGERFATLSADRPAALGFEAPLFIPCHKEFQRITAQRLGEHGKPWSAGAGATVTTIGLAVMLYTLRATKSQMNSTRRVTLDWLRWPQLDDILIFEAFVSGSNHGGPAEHSRDALTAASGFLRALPNLDIANAVTGDEVLSLAGACLVRTGWSAASLQLLSEPCLVIRPDMAAEL